MLDEEVDPRIAGEVRIGKPIYRPVLEQSGGAVGLLEHAGCVGLCCYDAIRISQRLSVRLFIAVLTILARDLTVQGRTWTFVCGAQRLVRPLSFVLVVGATKDGCPGAFQVLEGPVAQCEGGQLGEWARMEAKLVGDGFVDCRDPGWEVGGVRRVAENCIEGGVAKQDFFCRRVVEDKGRAVIVDEEADKEVELGGHVTAHCACHSICRPREESGEGSTQTVQYSNRPEASAKETLANS